MAYELCDMRERLLLRVEHIGDRRGEQLFCALMQKGLSFPLGRSPRSFARFIASGMACTPLRISKSGLKRAEWGSVRLK